ncbi:MAG TPA: M4 family metallopeptidase [Nocardioidaceae bacterium]|nr:M4 family metallopeptidase [Nocardioidaceae bacterium]
MRRLVAAPGAAILAVGLGVVGTTVGTSAGAAPASDERSPAAVANDYIGDHLGSIKGSTADSYRVVDTITGVDGAQHIRYERTYQGLPVLGGDFVVHQDADGAVDGVSVAQARAIDISATPRIAAADVAAKTRHAFDGAKIADVSKPQLVVDARYGAPQLAWMSVVHGVQSDGQTPSRATVLVDALSGEILDADESVTTLAPLDTTSSSGNLSDDAQVADVGTGQSIYLGQVEIDTTAGGSGFEMVDPSHGNGTTCDMNNSEAQCTTLVDDDNAWGDGTNADRASAGVDAHLGAALTFDYYTATHNWNGIFNDGTGVPSRVHYGNAYVNAFWDGQQMTYGDGENNDRPLVSLDVAGHEMSHGVTENTAGLEYSGDAGGLNEATSDIFGSMVEFYANNAADPGDYDIGEKIDIFGTGEPLRYMYQPSLDGSSYDCWDSSVPGSDPHYSSGVGNHFFFLLAEGSGDTQYGSSPICDGSTVTGIGRDKAAQIWFTALSQYMTSTETYSDARAHTIQAATDLYGAGSPEVQTVEAAWTAVSVS